MVRSFLVKGRSYIYKGYVQESATKENRLTLKKLPFIIIFVNKEKRRYLYENCEYSDRCARRNEVIFGL